MSVNYSKRTPSLVDTGINGGSLVPFQPQADSLTYEPFFGLTEKPFSLNSDARFVFESPTYGATRESLLAGIRRREGLLVLTGEIGTGKTTLCHAVLRDLGRKTYSSMVPDPFASREDLLKMLLIDFGVMSIQELTTGNLRQASRTELSYLLAEFLNSLAADAFAVVMIDEAQNLTLPLIEETRILSDSFGAEGRLQIVFVGQPELHSKLKLPEMRQVDQRVCGYHRLAPMSRAAVEGYITHRLVAAGGRPDRVLFSSDIVQRLHVRTGGVPRLINRVCDRALQIAFEQKAERVDRVTLEAALSGIGSATLSPTWDAIMAGVPAPQHGVEAPLPAAAPATPQPAASTAPDLDLPPSLDEAADFQTEIDQWVSKELGPPARALSPIFAEVTPEQLQAWRRSPRTAPPREAPAGDLKLDWPADVRAETVVQRVWRVWTKRLAMAGAVFVCALLATRLIPAQAPGATLFEGATIPEDAPTHPAPIAGMSVPLDNAPKPEVAAIEAPAIEALVALNTPSAVAPPAASPVVPAAPDYLVAVGLYSSQQRADQLVDKLTEAGLHAMQRPFRMRNREVQQIVLGPFFSRADAVADLQRLKALGGYDDAAVIDNPRQASQ